MRFECAENHEGLSIRDIYADVDNKNLCDIEGLQHIQLPRLPQLSESKEVGLLRAELEAMREDISQICESKHQRQCF